jgi:Alpha/beta hydrolase domain
VLRDASMQLESVPVGLTDVLRQAHPGADLPLWSRVPNADAMKAALHALERWLTTGTPPPVAPRLALDEQGRLQHDAAGRVLGGIRYAAYEVPSAENVGATRTGCPVAGHHRDFEAPDMRSRYGTAAAYRARVEASVNDSVVAGFLLPEDAERVIAAAFATSRNFE